MDDVLIREATESDLPAIERLIVELAESMDSREGIDPEMASENCRSLLSDMNSCILVAEIGGMLIGLINLTVRKTLLHSGSSGLIDELVVAKDYRGEGVGRQLMYAAVEKCRQVGCSEVEVSTEFSNATAREFYASHGFEERGVILEKDLLSDETAIV